MQPNMFPMLWLCSQKSYSQIYCLSMVIHSTQMSQSSYFNFLQETQLQLSLNDLSHTVLQCVICFKFFRQVKQLNTNNESKFFFFPLWINVYLPLIPAVNKYEFHQLELQIEYPECFPCRNIFPLNLLLVTKCSESVLPLNSSLEILILRVSCPNTLQQVDSFICFHWTLIFCKFTYLK